jgi:arylsulfatase A-like enzyme
MHQTECSYYEHSGRARVSVALPLAGGDFTLRPVMAPRLSLLLAILALATTALVAAPPATARPNILWFVVDDMSPNFSCYGETAVRTPHVDRLAAEGVRFSRAYITAPVCSAARSAMITGMYQTTIGAHHHRSGRGVLRIKLPEGVVPIPQILRAAGYFTAIGSGLPDRDFRGLPFPVGAKAGARSRFGKTDYNFDWDPAIYDAPDWSGRAPGQPFFMQVQLHGGKLRGNSIATNRALAARARSELGSATPVDAVVLPPYYPRDPVMLEDWAAYLDSVRLTDDHVGHVLARLEREGILENTLVLFMTDHGISHARGKQFLYDEGTHIPFVIRGPGVPRGTVRADLIEHLDMAVLSLAAAGIPIPATMQGRNVLAADYRPRDAVFAARDRCDETVDRIRSVRTERFLYVRNFLPGRPHLQPNRYKDSKDIVKTLRALHAAGTLPALGEELLFRPMREAEELYDLTRDPWQVRNLAADPALAAVLADHRARLERWMVETRDPGPESAEQYDSDMAAYLDTNPDSALRATIALMKAWAAEGR